MRDRKSASSSSVVLGGDRETRYLVLWLLFGVVAVVVIGGLAVVALVSRPVAPSASVAVIPPLGAPSPAPAVPNFADEAPLSPAPAPIRIGPQEASADLARPAPTLETPPSWTVPRFPKTNTITLEQSLPLPPPRPDGLLPPERLGTGTGDAFARAAAHDPATAVYDISARTVTLPDGTRIEAHSGLGPLLDDTRAVNEADRGATPPHLYELTMREEIFHGVQALRLNPIGGGDMFGRNGLLAHPYMLGPRGDSNGCVSFKDYDAFLRAFQNGQVKRLAVVTRLDMTTAAR
jgi:hypothetical protein